MRIGVVGYYGKFNSGDDAMAAVCLTELSRRLPEAQFFVPSQPLIVPYGVNVVWQPLAHPWQRQLAGERRLCESRCDVLVFGGGSVFSDVTGTRMLESRYGRTSALRRQGTKLLALSVGIGPLATPAGRDVARSLLRLFEHIVVRDRSSLQLASDLGLTNVSLGFDVAALLETVGMPAQASVVTEPGKHVFGLSLCDYSRFIRRGVEADNRRLEKVVAGLRAVDWAGWRVRIVTLNGHPRLGDLDVAARLRSALRGVVECELCGYDPNPLGMLRAIGACDAMLSMRLHGAVYAYVSERPFAVLAYHPKCAGFAASVNVPRELVLDSEEFAPNELGAMVSHLKSSPAPQLLPLMQAQKMARQGVGRLVDVLEGVET